MILPAAPPPPPPQVSSPSTHFWHGARDPTGDGESVTVPLPYTNPGLFPLCQYTSKLLSCKVTSEVLFKLVCLRPDACSIPVHAVVVCCLLLCSIRMPRKRPPLHVYFLSDLSELGS